MKIQDYSPALRLKISARCTIELSLRALLARERSAKCVPLRQASERSRSRTRAGRGVFFISYFFFLFMDRLNGHSSGTDTFISTETQESQNGHRESSDATRALQIAALQQREMKVVRLDVMRAVRSGVNR